MDGLIIDMRRWQEVPTLVATDFFILSENLLCLYFLASRAYWVREFSSEARVSERQKLFAG